MPEIRDSDIDRFYGEYERPVRGPIGQCAECGEDIEAHDTYYIDMDAVEQTLYCETCANDERNIDYYMANKFDKYEKQELLHWERMDD